ncbi:MAG: hypothetical protein A2Z52_02955 [Candidatus Moranbacteria bacterium RBG_19FT_COMBO_42_6]|nr:MAG: hypothetical protein A2Z52_02955 [Candidatus Moranbacteria bacterium RBG_19FT_COMBO_42_6]
MDYPMTSFEIWKYLFRVNKDSLRKGEGKEAEPTFLEVMDELKSEKLNGLLEEFRGFYFLKGRKSLVEQRIKRNKISEKKYKILEQVARVLRFIPYVRMVAVTGRMAMKNAEEKSDLDLLLVLEKGKIFTGRILVTLVVHLMGRRRYRGKIANRICLNYFITTGSLEIGLKDMFSSSEYYFMLPLFGLETFREFQAKNRWIGEYKVNYEKDGVDNLRMLFDSWPARFSRNLGEKILRAGFIEKSLKNWQMKRINRNPKTHQSGSMVSASEEALIFLPNPQGPKIYDKFQDRLSSLAQAQR